MAHLRNKNVQHWHIPCYANYNCPTRSDPASGSRAETVSDKPHDSAGFGSDLSKMMSGLGDSDLDPDLALTSSFLWLLVLASLLGILIVGVALCSRGGFRRQLNAFLLTLLCSDLLMAVVVMPLYALSYASQTAMPWTTCRAWVYVHLLVVGVRSWVLPATTMLHFLHDGIIPRGRLLLTLIWVWVMSGLLVLPAHLAADTFLDSETCSVRQGNFPLLAYVVIMLFFLPAGLLGPAFLKWSQMTTKFNINEFNSCDELEEMAAGSNSDRDASDRSMSRRSIDKLRQILVVKGDVSQKVDILHMTDKDFPGALYTFTISHAVAWSPFFVAILLPSVLANPIPVFVLNTVLWLGFAQSVVTPILIPMISRRIAVVIARGCECEFLACGSRRRKVVGESDERSSQSTSVSEDAPMDV